MRILHIIDTIGIGGGAERNLASVLPAMRGPEHHVVHLFRPDGFAPSLRAAGVIVERVPLDGPRDLPRALARLRALAARVDVVHTQVQWSDLLGRLSSLGSTPTVVSVQTPPYEPVDVAEYSFKGRVKTSGFRVTDVLLSRRTRRFVAVSEYVRDTLVERLHVPRDRTRVVYNAVDVSSIQPLAAADRAAVRAELGLADGEIGVVSAGKLHRNKGPQILVDALPELLRGAPRARLLLAGTGPLRDALERRARELGVEERVRFLGLRQDMLRVLAACDLFVLPSRNEGLSLAVAEAMASRLACVLSPIAPHLEMQRRVDAIDSASASAMVADDLSPSAFARALASLAQDSTKRERLAEAGRAAAERHFNVEVTAPAMLEVFSEAARLR